MPFPQNFPQFLTALAAAVVLSATWPAAAQTPAEKPIKQATEKKQKVKKEKAVAGAEKSKKPAAKKAPKPKAKTSEATTAEERRLIRECKNRPNAGVCLGYKN